MGLKIGDRVRYYGNSQAEGEIIDLGFRPHWHGYNVAMAEVNWDNDSWNVGDTWYKLTELIYIPPKTNKRDDCVRCQNSASDVSHEVCIILYGEDYDTDLMLEDTDYEYEN